MPENVCDVINDVVILPEMEQTWELICQQLIEEERQTIEELFGDSCIPRTKQAAVLTDGSLQIYVRGKGGKIVLDIPAEAWSYKSLH